MRRAASWLLAGWLAAGAARASDWPQWRGPERTGQVPEGVTVPQVLPASPKMLWKTKVGDGLASPVVAGDAVFYLDNQEGSETLHAVKKYDGVELWRATIDKVFGDNQSAPGPRCTPLVDGGLIYAQSCRGELKCLRLADHTLVWHVNYTTDFSAKFIGEKGSATGASRHGNNGSPVIDGDKLYAAVGGTNGECVVCFEKTTGKVVWKSQNDQASYSAPMVVTILGLKQLVYFSAEGLMGLNLDDGKLLWRVPLKTSSGRHVTTPVIASDIVVVGSHEIGLVGVKISRTGASWEAAKAWANKGEAVNFASPVLRGDYVYALGPRKNFICVEVKTGKQMWSQDGYIAGADYNAYAAFIVMGKNILALTDGGQLVLFAADPTRFKEIGSAQVCGKTWCSPAYADGELFLRDGRQLMGVKIGE